MIKQHAIREAFNKNEGIFRMAPNFIAYTFSKPGRRLRLHPNDYYAFGMKKGAIKERWFSSQRAIRGEEGDKPLEGMSYAAMDDDMENNISFKDVLEELGADLIGETLMHTYGTFPIHAKFFDYAEPLFHHLHLSDETAKNIGRSGKPEAYYYPPQLNNYTGTAPFTYFGFAPDVTKEQVRERLTLYETGDNRITELSRAYRIELGTGWYTPGGVLHAPGSCLTYEPQWNSFVGSVYENVTAGEVNAYASLVGSCPADKKDDLDYIISLMDWEINVDPDFRKHYFRPPVICAHDEKHMDKWIVYANEYFAAKELTVYPLQEIIIKDPAAYGCILTQGHGRLGIFKAETPTMIRFGQMTADEFFVSEAAAKNGVKIVNESKWEPLVLLKHFANNNNEAP